MDRRIIFWDIDGTLLDKSLEQLFLKFLRREQRFSWSKTLAHAFKQCLTRSPMWYRLKLMHLRGAHVEDVRSLAERFFREVAQSRLRPGLTQAITSLNDMNNTQVLLSGTPEFLARPVADHLGVQDVIAAQPEIIESRLTGSLTRRHPFGKHKLEAAAAWLADHGYGWQRTAAIADHWRDRYLLRAVERAIVVNPGRRLAREAARRDWGVVSLPAEPDDVANLMTG